VTERISAFFCAGHGAGLIGSNPCGAGRCLAVPVSAGRSDAFRQALARLGGNEIAFRFASRRGSPRD
jgi:hypothetical protein